MYVHSTAGNSLTMPSPAFTLTNTHRKLDGSCQCGGVEFTLQSQTPVPYQLCACSICRKVGGYSGSVNLGGIADTLEIRKGKDLIKYGNRSHGRRSAVSIERFGC